MTEKEKAAVCLYCTEPECMGEAECFANKQKEYQKSIMRNAAKVNKR